MKKAAVFASCLVLGALGLSANEWFVDTSVSPNTISDGVFTFRIKSWEGDKFKVYDNCTSAAQIPLYPDTPSVLDFRGPYKDAAGNEYGFYCPLPNYTFISYNQTTAPTANFRSSVSKVYLPEITHFNNTVLMSYVPPGANWPNLEEVVIPSCTTNFPGSPWTYFGGGGTEEKPWKVVFEAGCLHGVWSAGVGTKPGSGKYMKIVYAGRENVPEGDWYIGTDGEFTSIHNSSFKDHTFEVGRLFIGPNVTAPSGYFFANSSGSSYAGTATITNFTFTGAKPPVPQNIRLYNGLEHKCRYDYPIGAAGWQEFIDTYKQTTTNETLAAKISDYQAIFGTDPEAQPDVWLIVGGGNNARYFAYKGYVPAAEGVTFTVLSSLGPDTLIGSLSPDYGLYQNVNTAVVTEFTCSQYGENDGVLYECVGYTLNGEEHPGSRSCPTAGLADGMYELVWNWSPVAYRLKIFGENDYGSVAISGDDCLDGNTGYYTPGSSVTLTANKVGEKTKFYGWAGSEGFLPAKRIGTVGPVTFTTIASPMEVYADFYRGWWTVNTATKTMSNGGSWPDWPYSSLSDGVITLYGNPDGGVNAPLAATRPEYPTVLDLTGDFVDVDDANTTYKMGALPNYFPFAIQYRSATMQAYRNVLREFHTPEVPTLPPNLCTSTQGCYSNLVKIVVSSAVTNIPNDFLQYTGIGNPADKPVNIVFETPATSRRFGSHLFKFPGGSSLRIVFGDDVFENGVVPLGLDGSEAIVGSSFMQDHTVDIGRLVCGGNVVVVDGVLYCNTNGTSSAASMSSLTNITFRSSLPPGMAAGRTRPYTVSACRYDYPKGFADWDEFIAENKVNTVPQANLDQFQAIYGTDPDAQPDVWIRMGGNYFPMKSYRPVRRGLLLILR